MPYARNRGLPDAVLGVRPEHAQEISRKANENVRDRRGQSSREEAVA